MTSNNLYYVQSLGWNTEDVRERESVKSTEACARAIVCVISCQGPCCKMVEGSYCEFIDLASFLLLLISCIVYKLSFMAR